MISDVYKFITKKFYNHFIYNINFQCDFSKYDYILSDDEKDEFKKLREKFYTLIVNKIDTEASKKFKSLAPQRLE